MPKNKIYWAKLTHDERVSIVVDYLKESFSETQFTNFGDSKHASIKDSMRKYNLSFDALKKANVYMKTPPLKKWSPEQQYDYCKRYVKTFSECGEFNYRAHTGINKFMLKNNIRDRILDETGIYLKGKHLCSMTKKQRYSYCLLEAKKHIKDGIFSINNETAALNRIMVDDGIRDRVLKKLDARLSLVWSNMTKEKLIITLVDLVKKHSLNGIFSPTDNKNIAETMKRYDVYEIVLQKAKVITRGQVRNSFSHMTTKERFKYIYGYIRKHTKNGVFERSQHERFYELALRYGLYYIALNIVRGKTNGLLEGQNRSNLQWYPERIEKLIILMSMYKKHSIVKCKTLNELVATVLSKDKDKILKHYSGSHVQLIKMLSQSFPCKDIQLNSLYSNNMDQILDPSLRGNGLQSIKQAKSYFIKTFLVKALKHNIFVPAATQHANGTYVDVFIKSQKKKIKKPDSMYEHCLMVWSEKHERKYETLIFIRSLSECSPKEFEYESVEKFNNSFFDNSSKTTCPNIIRKLLKPLQEKGILSEFLFKKSPFYQWYEDHRKYKNDIRKNGRTVMWYALEAYADSCLTSHTKRSNFVTKFKGMGNIRAIDLNKEHVKLLHSRSGLSEIQVINTIMLDGLCSYEVFNASNTNDDCITYFNWKSNMWLYGKYSNEKYDFTLIDESYREAAKNYTWEITNELTKQQKGWVDLIDISKLLIRLGINTLSDLNSDTKKYFYLELKFMEQQGIDQHRKAFRLLKKFRSFINTLINLEYKEIDSSISLKNDGFTISHIASEVEIYTDNEMQIIVDFLKSDESVTNQFMSRLELCAFGMSVFFARRIGETVKSTNVKSSTGFTINTLTNWGMSDELMLKYYSPKHKAWETVLLSDIIGDRDDPIANEILGLGVSLYQEAITITSSYREYLPENLKNILFVAVNSKGGFSPITDVALRNKVYNFYRFVGIDDTKKGIHEFRHTMASNIIMSGGTLADAADALKDTIQTTVKYYQKFSDRSDTLKLFSKMHRTRMVDAKKDSAHFDALNKKQHKVLMPEQMSPNGQKMVGGTCVTTIKEMLDCPSYQMINDASGCPGCRFLEVNAVENKEFWQAQKKIKLEDMDSSEEGSIGYRFAKINYDRAADMVLDFEEKELEYELS